MRQLSTLLLVSSIAVSAAAAAWIARPEPVRADQVSTLYMSGFEIGSGRRAIVRLRNTSTHAADTFTVRYTVRDPGAGVPISQPGAGDGARLAAGQTLELDLGEIVDAYRAGLDVGEYAGPVQFVAFGTGGQFASFGPDVVIAEGLQTIKRATFGVAVEWVFE